MHASKHMHRPFGSSSKKVGVAENVDASVSHKSEHRLADLTLSTYPSASPPQRTP